MTEHKLEMLFGADLGNAGDVSVQAYGHGDADLFLRVASGLYAEVRLVPGADRQLSEALQQGEARAEIELWDDESIALFRSDDDEHSYMLGLRGATTCLDFEADEARALAAALLRAADVKDAYDAGRTPGA